MSRAARLGAIYSSGIKSVPIYIGFPAVSGISGGDMSGYTLILENSPANASGKINTIEIYPYQDISGLYVATFYSTDVNEFSARSRANIGSVSSGAIRTFSVDIDVVAGDFLGFYMTSGEFMYNEYRDIGITTTAWVAAGNRTASANYQYTYDDNGSVYGYSISLYGIGST